MKTLKQMIAGLILIFVDIPIKVVSYPIQHKDLEGVKYFVINNLNQKFAGTHLTIDILPDIIGYLILLFALYQLFEYHHRFRMAATASIVGGISHILLKILPFLLKDFVLLAVILSLMVIEILAVSVMQYSIVIGLTSRLDPLKHVEVKKDLLFAWEICFICSLLGPVISLGTSITIITLLYYLYRIVFIGCFLYYSWCIYEYNKKYQIINS